MSQSKRVDRTNEQNVQITPKQMWDARLLLGWTRERLASVAGATGQFVYTYETDGRVMTMYSRERSFDGLAAIRAALEEAGVEFTNEREPGVKLLNFKAP